MVVVAVWPLLVQTDFLDFLAAAAAAAVRLVLICRHQTTHSDSHPGTNAIVLLLIFGVFRIVGQVLINNPNITGECQTD